VVVGTLANTVSNRELQEAANPVQIRMNPRHRAKRLGVHSALQARASKASSEHFASRATRLAGERIEPNEVVLVHAQANHTTLRLLRAADSLTHRPAP